MSSMTPPPGSMSRRITKLLIANRGEIAVRIARTAHRLGISTVGVYSEPDADALHVDGVDVAVALGGSTPADSYLRAAAIVEIALRHGCEAIHPGYGFLAENADVAERVAAAGLIWVGPTADQIRTLGDKVAAKKLAIASGVPTAPLFEITAGADGAVRIPDGIPMPALVKAAAGGGGELSHTAETNRRRQRGPLPASWRLPGFHSAKRTRKGIGGGLPTHRGPLDV